MSVIIQGSPVNLTRTANRALMKQEMSLQEKETQSKLWEKTQQEVSNQRCTQPIRLLN